MAICEKCGSRFAPTAEAPSCPECGGAPRKRSATGAASSSTGASGKSSGAASSSTGSSARVRPPSSAGSPAPAVRREAAPAAAAVRRPAAAAPAPPAAHRPTHAPTHHPVHLPVEKPLLDGATKMGFIVTGVLALIVIGVVVVVKGKKAEERAAAAALEKQVTDLHDELAKLDVNDEANVARVIQLAQDKQALWQDHALAPDFQSLMAKARTSLETTKERKATIAEFELIEKGLKNAAELPPDKIKVLKRDLADIKSKIDLGGPDYVARHAIAEGMIDKTYATRLIDDAKSFEKASPDNLRPILVKYQTAEDELKLLLDESIKKKNTELQELYQPMYKTAIENADRVATALFTNDVIEKLPWTDVLSGQQATFWNATGANVKGFSHRIEQGVLWINGPDADAGKNAVITIGDREQWRNFVVDLEFTVEKGNLETYYRLGNRPNLQTILYDLATEGDRANLKAGKAFRCKVSMIGSDFNVTYPEGDLDSPPPVHNSDISWTKNRKGAIGILVPPGARARFTRFRVRELR